MTHLVRSSRFRINSAVAAVLLAVSLAVAIGAAARLGPQLVPDGGTSSMWTVLISAASGGALADGPSGQPALSGDGRYVVFESTASNLGDSRGSRPGAYVRDTQNRTTRRLDVNAAGRAADGGSHEPRVSADGSVVVFVSAAQNLNPGSAGTRQAHIFARDLSTTAEQDSLELVDVAVGTRKPGDGPSRAPGASRDGRIVVFESQATNLVDVLVPGGQTHVYLRDRQSRTTELIDVGMDNVSPSNGSAGAPQVSADGRFVVFLSDAPDLVVGTPRGWHVYLRDRMKKTTALIDTAPAGAGAANGSALRAAVSASGRHVAFVSDATDLVPGLGTAPHVRVYVWDRRAPAAVAMRVLSLAPDGTDLLVNAAAGVAISAGGRYVAFQTIAVGTGTSPERVVVWDRDATDTPGGALVDAGDAGLAPASGAAASLDLSADGRYVAYTTAKTRTRPTGVVRCGPLGERDRGSDDTADDDADDSLGGGMPGPRAVTYRLTVVDTGRASQITSAPAGIDWTPGSPNNYFDFPEGTPVVLSATHKSLGMLPIPGGAFTVRGWVCDATTWVPAGSAIVMDRNHNGCRPVFEASDGRVSFDRSRLASYTGSPFVVAEGELNGDGVSDVVDGSGIAGNLSDGLGGFTRVNSELANLGKIATGDFNQDGFADVAGLAGSNTLVIAPGTGSGSFQHLIRYPTAHWGIDLTVGDFNEDRVPDVAVLCADGGVSLLLGRGDATFVLPAGETPVLPNMPLDLNSDTRFRLLAQGDFDGDGHTDLVASMPGSATAAATVRAVFGRGDGTFSDAVTLPGVWCSVGSGYPGSTVSLAAADLDEDGRTDVVYLPGCGAGGDDLIVAYGLAGRTFRKQTYETALDTAEGRTVGYGYQPRFSTADVSMDGHADVVVESGGGDSGSILLLLGDGAGALSPALIRDASEGSRVLVVDVNADGRTDLVTDFKEVLLNTSAASAAPLALTVATAGAGTGAVTSAPAGITCNPTCTATFPRNATVNLLAAPADGSVFVGWGDACRGTALRCQVSMTQAQAVTARFEPNDRVLTVSRIGAGYGTVNAPAQGIACGADCVERYATTTTVTLTAEAAFGSKFAGWGPHGTCPYSGSTCEVSVASATSVTARFEVTPFYTLTAQSPFGRVTTSPRGVNGELDTGDPVHPTWWASYPAGTEVALSIAPKALNPEFAVGPLQLMGWSGYYGFPTAGDCWDGRVTMTGDQSCFPWFRGTTGVFAVAPGVPMGGGATGSYPHGLKVADVNGDGHADGVAAWWGGITTYRWSPAGYTLIQSPGISEYDALGGFAVGDYNEDGKADLIVAKAVTAVPSYQLFTGAGDGTFAAAAALELPSLVNGDVTAGDFDGDGNVDVAGLAMPGISSPGWLVVARGKGDGTFHPAATYETGPGWGFNHRARMGAGDFNGDGKTDFAVHVYAVPDTTATEGIVALINTGTGAFDAPEVIAHATVSQSLEPWGLTTIDLNGDGTDEVTFDRWVDPGPIRQGWVMSRSIGGAWALAGAFDTQAIVGRSGTFLLDLSAGDFDGDGAEDLAAMAGPGFVVLYRNDAGNLVQGLVQDFSNVGPNRFVAADLNGDSRPDLLFNNGTSLLNAKGVARPTLTVVKTGTDAGTVASIPRSAGQPPDIDCGPTCAASLPAGSMIELTATPDRYATFAGWTGACTGTSTHCFASVTESQTTTATFNAIARPLTVLSRGDGTVSAQQAGAPTLTCPPDCTGSFLKEPSVLVTAQPAAGWAFLGWGDDCTGRAPCSLTMSTHRLVSATFAQKFPLVVTVAGHGIVTSSPAGIDCPDLLCTADLAGTVTLTATPDAGHVLQSWGGACTGAAATCQVEMSQARNVSATFVQAGFDLAVTVVGNGSVTSTPAGLTCPGTCTHQFPPNQQVTLTPTPDAEWAFVKWTGGCTGSGACTVTMDTAKNVTATFGRLQPADLNPGNWRIEMGEALPYLNAWLRNQAWSAGPNPIPMAYALGSGNTWLRGSLYYYDAGLACPSCWVVGAAPSVPAGGRPAVSRPRPQPPQPAVGEWATRTLPSCYTAGTAGNVSIGITPPVGTQVWAVEEFVPAGWAITNVNESGVVNATANSIRWFALGAGKTLQYTVTPPSGTTGSGSFTGTVGIDDQPAQTISGAGTLGACGASGPDLGLTKTHAGSFTVGTNGVYALTVTNGGTGDTTTAITVTDALPTGLSYVSGTGTGWTCGAAAQMVTCTHAGPAAKSTSLPAITLTVGVAQTAVPSVTNTATVATTGDSNATNNIASDPTTVTSGGGTAWATRVLPSCYTAGAAANVSIGVTPPAGTQVWAVEEFVPAGWAVTNVNESGVVNPTANSIRWFALGAGKTLQYTATPPAGAIGSGSFTGTVGIDDQPAQTIAGPGSLTPCGMATQVLSVASSNPDSGVAITVSPADQDGAGTGATSFTRTYARNTQVTLTAPSTAGDNTFSKWTRDGSDFVTTPATVVTMDADHLLTAVYTTGCARTVQVVGVSGIAGATIQVPVELVAAGNENALSFTVTFDPAVLGSPDAAKGSAASDATLFENGTQAATGKYGVLLGLPAGQVFAAGTRQVVVMTFTIAAGASAGTTPVAFGDTPIAREVTDEAATVLPACWSGGHVTVTQGYEGDVMPAPNGDNRVTAADWVQLGRWVAQLDAAPTGGQCLKADDAPMSTKGDGRLSAADWVQTGRYVAALDALQFAGGPACGVSAPQRARPASADAATRTVRVAHRQLVRGETGVVTVELDAVGNENALSYSLAFDPTTLTFVGAEMPAGLEATLFVNGTQAATGRVGILLGLEAGLAFTAGTHPILKLTLTAAADGAGSTLVGFGDVPVARETTDALANVLTTSYTDGTITLLAVPGTFTKTMPANGAVDQPQALALGWGTAAGATSYEYCLDTSANGVCDGTWTSTGTAAGVDVSGLTAGTIYQWQARARNDAGTTEADAGTWWTFRTLPPRTLTVAKAGNGSGTVTSTPAGVDCGGDCVQAYDHGTVVTLTAAPEAGSLFSGWSGDCTGSTASTDVTMDADRACAATFVLDCRHTLTPATKSFQSKGGSGTFTVTMAGPAGCTWTAETTTPWITVTQGSGSTSGVAQYTVNANPLSSLRVGTITVGSQTHTVSQSGVACRYTLAPTSFPAPAGGGAGTTTVTASAGDCAWTATSPATWVTAPAPGTGSGPAAFMVASNTGPGPRNATLKIAGKPFRVIQAGCAYAIQPTTATFTAAGGAGEVDVTCTGGGCAWTAKTTASWITITSGAAGAGDGTLTYTVAPRTSGKSRKGTITIAGKKVTITQN